MKLLVVMPTKYLGNMVIAMQAIAAIIDHHEKDELVLVFDDSFKGLVRLAFGDGHHLLFYPRRGLGGSSISGRIRRFFGFLSALRRTRFDTIVDLDGTVVSGRIVSMARGRVRIGPDFSKRPGVYSTLIRNDRDSQHCFDDFRVMAEAIGVTVPRRAYLNLRSADDGAWPASGPPSPAPSVRTACIHPSATKDYKQWDIDRFAALADWLMERGWQVYVVGAGAAEKRRVEQMLARTQHRPVNAHGELDLVQLVYLLQHSDVFVGNDSGPMHLAATTGVTVIALFGPTELHRWQPMSDSVTVVRGEQPCSPHCRPEACRRNYQCMRSLTVEQVKNAVASAAGSS